MAREQGLTGAGLALDQERALERDRAVDGLDERPRHDVGVGAAELVEIIVFLGLGLDLGHVRILRSVDVGGADHRRFEAAGAAAFEPQRGATVG